MASVYAQERLWNILCQMTVNVEEYMSAMTNI